MPLIRLSAEAGFAILAMHARKRRVESPASRNKIVQRDHHLARDGAGPKYQPAPELSAKPSATWLPGILPPAKTVAAIDDNRAKARLSKMLHRFSRCITKCCQLATST